MNWQIDQGIVLSLYVSVWTKKKALLNEMMMVNFISTALYISTHNSHMYHMPHEYETKVSLLPMNSQI